MALRLRPLGGSSIRHCPTATTPRDPPTTTGTTTTTAPSPCRTTRAPTRRSPSSTRTESALQVRRREKERETLRGSSGNDRLTGTVLPHSITAHDVPMLISHTAAMNASRRNNCSREFVVPFRVLHILIQSRTELICRLMRKRRFLSCLCSSFRHCRPSSAPAAAAGCPISGDDGRRVRRSLPICSHPEPWTYHGECMAN